MNSFFGLLFGLEFGFSGDMGLGFQIRVPMSDLLVWSVVNHDDLTFGFGY